jgi:O-antigen/teichoic acid export membrane protein
MKLRDTLLTGAASYLQMASGALVSLLSIPLALHFLSNERFGLWSFTSQCVGYLLLLDFGVSNSVARLMADPIHRGQAEHWNGWFNLILAITVLQAMVILGVGLALTDWALRWFGIPAPLLPEAARLWKWMLVLNALNQPFRVLPGILAAQNRLYLALAGATAGAWLGLPCFYCFLRAGSGTLAYAWTSSVTLLLGWLVAGWAVARGPNRFRFSLRHVPWRKTRELFAFSSAVFVVGVAVQVAFMSQALIITKVAGLTAVAAFTVCSRVPMLLMQLVWRPIDAFMPRWQIYWCRDDHGPFRAEFQRGVRLTMGLALAAVIGSVAVNRWAVCLLAKPHLYLGKGFDCLFALYVLGQVWVHCVSSAFVLAKQMNRFAGVVILDTLLALGLCVAATACFGVIGYLGAATACAVLGLGFWYITFAGPPAAGCAGPEFRAATTSGWRTGLLLLAAEAALFALIPARDGLLLATAEAAWAAVAVGLAFRLGRHEWPDWPARLRHARQKLFAPQT